MKNEGDRKRFEGHVLLEKMFFFIQYFVCNICSSLAGKMNSIGNL